MISRRAMLEELERCAAYFAGRKPYDNHIARYSKRLHKLVMAELAKAPAADGYQFYSGYDDAGPEYHERTDPS